MKNWNGIHHAAIVAGILIVALAVWDRDWNAVVGWLIALAYMTGRVRGT